MVTADSKCKEKGEKGRVCVGTFTVFSAVCVCFPNCTGSGQVGSSKEAFFQEWSLWGWKAKLTSLGARASKVRASKTQENRRTQAYKALRRFVGSTELIHDF